jgi:hypothetical protein
MAGASEALEQDRFLMLFPGGATEAALRDLWSEPYRLKWEDRRGFLRLALEHDAEILFVAAVGIDDQYYQSRIGMPKLVLRALDGDRGRYSGARLPVGLLGGLPLPVQMSHTVSAPLDLGDRAQALESEDALNALHRRIWFECQSFLDDAVRAQRRCADFTDRATRRAERVLHQIGI